MNSTANGERDKQREREREGENSAVPVTNPCWAWITTLTCSHYLRLTKAVTFQIFQSFCNTRYYISYITFPATIQHYFKERWLQIHHKIQPKKEQNQQKPPQTTHQISQFVSYLQSGKMLQPVTNATEIVIKQTKNEYWRHSSLRETQAWGQFTLYTSD
jgi:hypothetical protein